MGEKALARIVHINHVVLGVVLKQNLALDI
jgi:hypothetical protein